jgi:bifunctional non-homologous end joining protein LigD
VFERLRRDKAARDCGMPARRTGEAAEELASSSMSMRLVTDAPTRELRLSNLKKALWPAFGDAPAITKGELIDYYRAIAPWLLPYLRDRPTVLTRFPDGIDGEMFYQKDTPEWSPPWLRTTTLWSEHSQREIHYLLLDDADGLAFVANLASIPIHAWASRSVALEHPDWTIIDLDPKNAPREHVVPLALAIHELCETVKLPNYVKTSGQTGLHVLIPLGGQCTFDQARTLAYLLSLIIERQHPTMATTARNPAARGGRVYLDWGQNAHGQLLVAPYSARPVAGASVSMPLVWDEVVPGLDPRQFHIKNALARVTSWPEDPCARVLVERPDLGAALTALEIHYKDG